jgi:hypothetical protein
LRARSPRRLCCPGPSVGAGRGESAKLFFKPKDKAGPDSLCLAGRHGVRMKYRVKRSDGTVIGTYEASSEDEVLAKVGADQGSGYPSRETAEAAAMDGAILIEGAE